MMTNISAEMKLVLFISLLLVLIASFIVYKLFPRKLKTDNYLKKWKELQGYCKNRSTWPQAIIMADDLLDQALKERKFKGKSMGERMVSAQKFFSNNDDLWFAHNLCKKIKADQVKKLNENDVKDALFGFRESLRDLGVLPMKKDTEKVTGK